MTHLNHPPPIIWPLHLFKVSMCQENLLHHHLPILDIDKVSNVVSMLSKHEDAGVDDFSDGTGEGEGQGDDACPESGQVFCPVLGEEVG